jgi:hypothetical protein
MEIILFIAFFYFVGFIFVKVVQMSDRKYEENAYKREISEININDSKKENKKNTMKREYKKIEKIQVSSKSANVKKEVSKYRRTKSTSIYNKSYSENFTYGERKGTEAENKVRDSLKKLNFAQYHNYTFKFNRRIYKVDHILLGEIGFFIIETKRWKGNISSRTNSDLVGVSRGNRTRKYSNPIVKHTELIKNLSNKLGVNDNLLKGVLLFVDSKSVIFENHNMPYFTSTRSLIRYLESFEKSKSVEEVNEMIDNLNKNYEPISRIDYYLNEHN